MVPFGSREKIFTFMFVPISNFMLKVLNVILETSTNLRNWSMVPLDKTTVHFYSFFVPFSNLQKMDVISRVPQPPLTPNPLFWKFLPKNRKNRNPSPALPLGMEHWKWKGESLLYIVLLSMPLYVTAKVVWHFVSLHVWHFVSCKIMYDTLHHFMSFIENRVYDTKVYDTKSVTIFTTQ